MRHKIRGKMWNVRYVPNMFNRGLCDHPTTKNKSITIRQGLKGVELMEVLLHEFLHAANWDLDEEVITEMADDISRAIWKELKEKGYINES